MAAKATGIGGVFFKCADPDKTRAWYADALGIDMEDYGGASFLWRDKDEPGRVGRTVWSLFAADTKYFGPTEAAFMINYRVDDLDAVLAHLADRGVERVGDIEDYPYGRFAWVMDPDGRKVELWEPRGERAGEAGGFD